MTRLRLAVIGAGHLGRIHARLAHEIEQFQLVGVVDPSNEAREQAARELGVPVFANHASVVTRIDAAVIATPTVCHQAVGMDLLQRGIHLLVEKPLAANASQANGLVKAARDHGLVLQVGHIEQFNPALEAARSLLEHPMYVEAIRTSSYTFRSTDIGVVLDLMIHDLDIVMTIVKSGVKQVHALGLSVFGKDEDMAQVRLEFHNGCVANLTASRTSYCSQRNMQVFGEDGYVFLDFARPSARSVRPSALFRERPLDIHGLSAHERNYWKDHVFDELLLTEDLKVSPRNALLEELYDFATSVQSGQSPRVTGEQGRDTLVIAEQILAKIRAHRWDSKSGDQWTRFNTPAAPMVHPTLWPTPTEASHVHQRKAG